MNHWMLARKWHVFEHTRRSAWDTWMAGLIAAALGAHATAANIRTCGGAAQSVALSAPQTRQLMYDSWNNA